MALKVLISAYYVITTNHRVNATFFLAAKRLHVCVCVCVCVVLTYCLLFIHPEIYQQQDTSWRYHPGDPSRFRSTCSSSSVESKSMLTDSHFPDGPEEKNFLQSLRTPAWTEVSIMHRPSAQHLTHDWQIDLHLRFLSLVSGKIKKKTKSLKPLKPAGCWS